MPIPPGNLRLSRKAVLRIARGAVVAALYTALTMLLMPISFSNIQFRVSEALTVLPVLMPEAIPGLFIGCLLSNLLGGFGVWDVVFGSLATLAAAILTRALRKNIYLALLPPVVVNAVVIGAMLHFVAGFPLLATMGLLAVEEGVVCYLLCPLLLKALRRLPSRTFE